MKFDFKKLGLFLKLIITISFFVLLSVVILSVFFIHHEKTVIRQEFQDRALSLANNLAYNCEYGVLTANVTELNRLIQGVLEQTDVAYCVIRDAKGELLASSKGSPQSGGQARLTQAQMRDVSILNSEKNLKQNYYDITLPVVSKTTDASVGEDVFSQDQASSKSSVIGSVEVGLSWNRIDILVKKVQGVVFVMVVVMFLISVMILFWVVKFLLSPIKVLIQATRQISSGNLNFRASVRSHDEIGILVASFNQMVDDLQKITVSRNDLVKEIEERKAAEDGMRHAKEEAEKANRAKSDFLANMSHEIRTPMNAILGFSYLLSATPLNADQKRYLNTVKASGDLLIGIIDDILDISKFESVKIKLECIKFNLENIVRDVFKMIVMKIKDKPYDTYVKIASDVPSEIMGDPTRLKQILVNLLGNAVKFTSLGSVGIIIEKDPTMPVEGGEIALKFTVKDTGIGVPQEKIHDIFKPFTQGDETTTRKFGGTGLGLTISQALVQAMGGKIWVESQKDIGSEFNFIIKLKKVHEAEALSPRIQSYPLLAGKKVFIVDDHQISLKILEKNCEKIGLQVYGVADSGYSALNKLQKLVDTRDLVPEIIFCDIIMEGMDGFQLVEEIKKMNGFEAVKFISVTADLNVQEKSSKKKVIFDGFVIKPVFLEDLVQTLDALYEVTRTLTPVEQPKKQHSGIRVLIVEDNEANLMLMEEFIHILEWDGVYAHNGQEAIDILRKDPHFNLCFMDLQMPVMGGFEATKIIREEITKNLPIVALSANVLSKDHDEAKVVGINWFLNKPVTFDGLQEAAQRFLIDPNSKEGGSH